VKPVRAAVVGLGYWGPNLVRNLFELGNDVDIAYVCDLDEAALAKTARRYPSIATTQRYDDLLADDALEAILIATPVSTHFSLASAALRAGKHVFVEKPLAASSAEGLELMQLAEKNRLVLMPGHTFLYSPPVNTIRTMIERGDLGEIYFVSTSRVNLGLHQADVSVAWDLGPHDFSILRYWFDQTPTHARAISRACVLPHVPDVAFIDLEYESGTIAHVELSWLAPSKLRRTTIVGSEKMVVYDDTGTEPVRVFDSGVTLPNPETFGEYRLTYRTGDIVSPRVDAREPLSLELSDFVDAVRTGSTPRSSARIGLEVVKMIEAVDSSLGRGGARVDIPSVEPAVAGP